MTDTSPPPERLYLDFDSFFASAEQHCTRMVARQTWHAVARLL